jgi:cAMP phosphodiesterase
MNKLVVVMALLVLYGCNTQQKKALAQIKVVSDSVNIGTVKKDSTAAASVMIYSAGNDSLCIKNIGVDCGCTKAEITDKKIAPNDSAVLQLSYDAKKGGDSGSFFKAIVVRSNAAEEYKVIRIYGKVQ